MHNRSPAETLGLCFRSYCNYYMKVRTASDLGHSDTGVGLVANRELSPTSLRAEPSGISLGDVHFTDSSSESLEQSSWYCLRCRRTQEKLSALHLRVLLGVAVFCPRIRFKQINRNAERWVTEPLFPGYFFAKFDSERAVADALAAYGASDVLKLGARYDAVSAEIISELKQQTRATEIGSLALALVPGGRWRVVASIVNGLEVVILRILPARERIALLLEFLRREASARLSDDSLCPSIASGWLLGFSARIQVHSARPVGRVSPKQEPTGRHRPKF
jgi:transcriptional antiterminator RfaH